MQLVRGQKIKLNDLLAFDIQVKLQSPFGVDVALFGLDKANTLSNESYMIFYNQLSSPCNALKLVRYDARFSQFSLNLHRLPNDINKLVLALSIDGNETMRQLGDSTVEIVSQTGERVAVFGFDGSMFAQERAIMAVEIYQRDGTWRLHAMGQGFNSGLSALIEHFGGEVAPEDLPTSSNPMPQTPPVQDIDKKTISLQKAEQTGNQSIIDLTKKSLVQLEKKGLLDVKARVALVLDASGSMNWQYKNGDVQKIVNRLMPLAINFDDDGSFECWAFANFTTQLDDVTLTNVNDFINQTHQGWKNWQVGARLNNEVPAIEAVIDYYYPRQPTANAPSGFFAKLQRQFAQKTPTPNQAPPPQEGLPIYVLFISDGGVGSAKQMQRILTECANLPIFWQFVGVGGSNYGVLERLDDLTGRVVDNCNFFALDNIASVSDDRLYELLLEEFPRWLDTAKRQGIIR